MDAPRSQSRGIADALGIPVDFHARPDGISAEPGAYILAIELAAALRFDRGRFAGAELAPGWYLYAGSARGPGGLRARIARHMRRDKTLHWHVDSVTVAAARVLAAAFPGAAECDLLARFAALPGIRVPLEGFGASDCKCCRSHFLAMDVVERT